MLFSGKTMTLPFLVHIKLMKTSSTDVFFIFPVHIDSLLMFYHPEPSNLQSHDIC